MALTAEQKEVARAAGIISDIDNIDPTTAGQLATLLPAAKALVTQYASAAPASVRKAACSRLAGWLFDSDPADVKAGGRIMQSSGAAQMLAPWRTLTIGLVEEVEEDV